MCALQRSSPLHPTTLKDHHGATLLLTLFNNHKLKPSKYFCNNPSKMPQRLRQVQPLVPACKLGNCPPHSRPSLPAPPHHKSSSSKVSMHLSIIISSSMGRSGSCKTRGGRGLNFSLRIAGPRQMRRPRYLRMPLSLRPTFLQLHLHCQLLARGKL